MSMSVGDSRPTASYRISFFANSAVNFVVNTSETPMQILQLHGKVHDNESRRSDGKY